MVYLPIRLNHKNQVFMQVNIAYIGIINWYQLLQVSVGIPGVLEACCSTLVKTVRISSNHYFSFGASTMNLHDPLVLQCFGRTQSILRSNSGSQACFWQVVRARVQDSDFSPFAWQYLFMACNPHWYNTWPTKQQVMDISINGISAV